MNNIIDNEFLDGCKTGAERHEYLRVRFIEGEKEECVMGEYYGICSNNGKPMPIEAVTLERIIKARSERGAVCVSAYNDQASYESNKANTVELIRKISGLKYMCLPVYMDRKPAFWLFNYNRKNELQIWGALYGFALNVCAEYKQDSVIIKAPNGSFVYVNEFDERVDSKEFTGQYYVNPMPAGNLTERIHRHCGFNELMLYDM